MPDILNPSEQARVVAQMLGITHGEGCWRLGPAHYACALKRIEGLENGSAPVACESIAERDAVIARLTARLQVVEADILRRQREPADRYERIAQLEAHNSERHQERLGRVARLRRLEGQARALETRALDALSFLALTAQMLGEIEELLKE